ncbi:MAG: sialidase family protein [Victivallales bacterium]
MNKQEEKKDRSAKVMEDAPLRLIPPQDRHSLVYRGFPPDLMCVDQYLRVLPDAGWAVFFTTGSAVEPDIGNYIAMCRSDDHGVTWGAMEPVLKLDDKGCTLTEVYVHGNQTFIYASLHGGCFDKWHNCILRSSDNGATWAEPEIFKPLPYRTFVRNRVLSSWGEWIFPFQTYETRGDFAPSPFDDGSFKVPMNGALITGDSGKTWTISSKVSGIDWAENNIVELSGEMLAMLVRADGTGCLYRSNSKDRGRTWSEPVPTDIPNPGAKFRLFRLKDGRVVLIHNPNPSRKGCTATSNQPNRNPLSMWISDDDMKTWGYRRMLTDFPGSLSYPDGFVDEKEEYVHFVFDYNRHDVIYWGAEIPASKVV